ncbi:MAG TPA: hypothetical protein PLX89_10955 [Verrucomicrobiota bacterium]|nr:hypothetical protein [Verrucomicrobiales bacterium]HRI13516.1 hypothetical protein [Verrucomicrobiota bacterium]
MTASRTITNSYRDFQLLDLSRLLKTSVGRGPFLLVQDGCDPSDPKLRECSFVLTRRGTWLHYYLFLTLPETVRRRCAMFEGSAEALSFAANLPAQVTVENPISLQELIHDSGFEPDASDAVGKALLEQLHDRHPVLPKLAA